MAEPVERNSRPSIEVRVTTGGQVIELTGSWNLRGVAAGVPNLGARLNALGRDEGFEWDLREVDVLDSAGAYLLWRAWGERMPKKCRLREEQIATFARWQSRIPAINSVAHPPVEGLVRVRRLLSDLSGHLASFITLLGHFVLDLAYLLRRPRDLPWREISATVHETGGRALGITALVGFLIGVVVSYLSSFQLQTFGAQIYIVNILGLSIIRELGPLLAAILVAGRSGSAMTARIGVMRVTQELDALSAMGISLSLRLILPKVIALTIALPLLVVWTDVIALAGGAISAHMELDVGYHQFLETLPDAVPVANFVIGLGKGAVFGLSIALIACHFGLRIRPNTESIGNETTNSVVAAITLVIIIDAVFAILFREIGLP
ncbi:MAG: MlaE family ABC transporter permease [Gammaproteobacteria bacterium]